MTAGRTAGSIGVMETTFPPAAQAGTRGGPHDQRSFLLQRAQPAMAGLIDGSLSTLAPVFAVAFATHQSHYAFLAGLGAGERLCDCGLRPDLGARLGVRGEEPQDGVGYLAGLLLRCQVAELREGHGLGTGDDLG